MPFSGIPVDAITESHLTELIQNAVPEGRDVDYKRSLPEGSDEKRKEFLADVVSFANTAGGHLIFGMDEDGGLPTAIAPITGVDMDAEVRRLESMMRDGIKPRLRAVRCCPVTLAKGSALVIRIPRSFEHPHMVAFKNDSKFYARNSAGKYPLDVSELRAAFLESEGISDQIRNFRLDRISMIAAEPARGDGGRLVLHLAPIARAEVGLSLRETFYNRDVRSLLQFISGGSANFLPTFDGLKAELVETGCSATLFRDGIVEAVDTELLKPHPDGSKFIPWKIHERDIAEAFASYLRLERVLGIEPPFLAMITMLDVRGYTLPNAGQRGRGQSHPVDRDHLVLPPSVFDSHDADVHAALKPAFDRIWNACRIVGSMNYALDGAWSGG